jgi:hypothetical protein
MEVKVRGVLDTPLEPVIGLAGGETRWRGTTAIVEWRRLRNLASAVHDCRKPMRKAPQWRPRMRIGEETSFIRTKLPPPMSRR